MLDEGHFQTKGRYLKVIGLVNPHQQVDAEARAV